ncbi:NmrA-like family domain-containing protein 1 [Colletotrichum fructicola Nara gc5]|uniref:NmrA-like family domain-containing protein 1 n=1 Tax=Colletotrichum fructicola (strain Nara gc5) TaxID=1213859 RepID=A0A7J6IRM2_COLFN|nr:NmrA-like family domain-containing protein 1 [Colletotrichum fructicola Nara gc5]
MSEIKAFIVLGATGRQGGAVVDALLTHAEIKILPTQVYAITRQPAGTAADRLRERFRGINIVIGDLGNPNAIFEQFNPETLNGKAFIDAAVAYGIPYLVYSSVDRGGRELSDADPSYCKTFSDKFYIERHLKNACSSKEVGTHNMDYTIIRPTWFADNAWWGFPGQLCMTGWRDNLGGKTLQVTVTKDIGRWAVEGLVRPDRTGIRNQALSIASDEISFDQVDAAFIKHTGRGVPVTTGLLARGIIWLVNDLNTMFRFIGDRGYGADLPWLKTHLKPTTFYEWVQSEVPKQA